MFLNLVFLLFINEICVTQYLHAFKVLDVIRTSKFQLLIPVKGFYDNMSICDQCIQFNCYTSQLKYVFRLEENASRAVGQNSLTP